MAGHIVNDGHNSSVAEQVVAAVDVFVWIGQSVGSRLAASGLWLRSTVYA